MSRSSLLAFAALTVFGCASPPPSAVDDEGPLVDLAACVRGDAICERSGAVETTDLLYSGQQALRLRALLRCGDNYCDQEKQECCAASPTQCVAKGACGDGPKVAPTPARISLPLQRPSDEARLRWIAVASSAYAGIGIDRRMTVTITGMPPTTLQPLLNSVARAEFAAGNVPPPPGARLEIEVLEGTFEISWVVGRWMR